MEALSRIKAKGFAVKLVGDNLEISPASALSQLQREFLTTHKAEIIAELKHQQILDKFLYWRIVRNGHATHIHMTPPHTLDEMRHIYRGADVIEPVES